MITNLLSNALKFGPGAHRDPRRRAPASSRCSSVRDHGLGIEPARQPFVFDRFERAVSATHYGGLGLGLYIARRIVQAHGGDLRVESEPGRAPPSPSPSHRPPPASPRRLRANAERLIHPAPSPDTGRDDF